MAVQNLKRSGPPPATTVRGAWLTYLRETRKLHGTQYEDVEPWMWARLQKNLKQLRSSSQP